MIKGVGPQRAELLAKRGIHTLEDLLSYLPFRYEDRIHFSNIKDIQPNGDAFVAESGAGQIRVLRGRGDDGKPQQVSVFATGLKQPYGINFYPSGANPQWVYIGNTNSVVRFAYKN